MLDRIDNSLAAAAKSLRDVVLPALDHGSPHALEQARLTADLLEIVRWQVAHVAERDAEELRRTIELAEGVLLAADVDDRATAELDAAVRAAHAVPAASRTGDLHRAAHALRDAVSGMVRRAQEWPEQRRDAVERAVLAGSRPLVELDRAWYLSFGLDPDPTQVTAWDDVLAARAQEAQC